MRQNILDPLLVLLGYGAKGFFAISVIFPPKIVTASHRDFCQPVSKGLSAAKRFERLKGSYKNLMGELGYFVFGRMPGHDRSHIALVPTKEDLKCVDVTFQNASDHHGIVACWVGGCPHGRNGSIEVQQLKTTQRKIDSLAIQEFHCCRGSSQSDTRKTFAKMHVHRKAEIGETRAAINEFRPIWCRRAL